MVLPGRSVREQILVKIFVLTPFAALVAAVPIAWGWGLGWTDPGLVAGFYIVACASRWPWPVSSPRRGR